MAMRASYFTSRVQTDPTVFSPENGRTPDDRLQSAFCRLDTRRNRWTHLHDKRPADGQITVLSIALSLTIRSRVYVDLHESNFLIRPGRGIRNALSEYIIDH